MNSSPRVKAGSECCRVSMLSKHLKCQLQFIQAAQGGEERRRGRENERDGERGCRRRRSSRGGCREWVGWPSCIVLGGLGWDGIFIGFGGKSHCKAYG